MPISVNKTKKFYVCYVLDVDALTRLGTIISAEGFAMRWMVFLNDGSSLSCPDLSDVLGISNTKEHRITLINCRGTHSNKYDEVKITFLDPSVLVSSIIYEVSGDEKTVTYVGEKLHEFVIEQRQWYTILRTLLPGMFFPLAFNVILIVFLLVKHWYLPDRIHPAYLSTVSGVVFGTGLYYIEMKMLEWLFPVAILAVGKGRERYETLQKMRERFFMGFVVATLAAVIGGLLIG